MAEQMIEVEVKFRAPDDVEERLKSAGFKFVEEKFEEDIYFNSPVRDFRKTDEALRLRRETSRRESRTEEVRKVKFTYKGRKIDRTTKTREELSVEVSDYEEMKKILERLGFKEVALVRKCRKIYELGGILACVDDVEGIGKFVEFEVCVKDGTNDKSVDEAKRRIEEVASNLGLGKLEDSITLSYLEMLLNGR